MTFTTTTHKSKVCPGCGETVFWDTEHEPHAWRHDHDSRWCEPPPGSLDPVMPPGTGNEHLGYPPRHSTGEFKVGVLALAEDMPLLGRHADLSKDAEAAA